jgi:serine/threonine protein kinase
MKPIEITKIGKYDVTGVIGRGGMGIVYKAVDPNIGRMVAIKMMTWGFEQNPKALKRFYREAQSVGTLQHPNIVIVYDLGEQDGNPYLVMEYLEGEPLERVIAARGAMSLVDKLGAVRKAALALDYAHQRGIIHRDVKPANIMVLRDGNVKLVDFGIAHVTDESFTLTGQTLGTPNYMSPEQVNGAVVDNRTDIFSLCVVLYELITFANPFGAKDTITTMRKIVQDAPPPIRQLLLGDVVEEADPEEIERILHRGLAKNRDERYGSAGDLAFELSRLQDRLKRRMVDQWVQRARSLKAQSEFAKANDLLREILTIDSNNQAAQRLMDELESELRREQRLRLVQQLCDQANEAATRQAYDEAIGYLDEGLAITASSEALAALRTQVLNAKSRTEQELQQATMAVLDITKSATDIRALDMAAEQIQNLRSKYGDAPPILSVSYEFENRRGALAEVAASEAIRRGRELMLLHDYKRIPEVLSSISTWLPYASADIRARYHALSRDAAERAENDEAVDLGNMTMIAGSDDLNNPTRTSADFSVPFAPTTAAPAQMSSPATLAATRTIHPSATQSTDTQSPSPLQPSATMNTLGALALNPTLPQTQDAAPSRGTLELLAEPAVRPSKRRFAIAGIVAVLILSGVVLVRSRLSDSRAPAPGTPAAATQPKSGAPGSTTVIAKPSATNSVALPAGSDAKSATSAGHNIQADVRSKTASDNTSKDSGQIRELIDQAQSQMDQGSYDDAISTYAAALQLDSHNSAARNGKRRAEKAKQYEQHLDDAQ